ncbi:protein tyrosine kinase [Ostertagia ostertagi]
MTIAWPRWTCALSGVFRYHHTNSVPVSRDILLKTPISKERWELTKDKVTLDTKIGEGAFGEVWKGTLKEDPSKPPIDVAVKVTKLCEENKAKIDDMHREARMMRQYKHRHVVAFHGVVNESADRVMIVMELINGGGLDHYLQKNPNVHFQSVNRLVLLAIKKETYAVHQLALRDVACRNCLIDEKNNIVKISDFGLSKQGDSYKVPEEEKLAIRWQAPEVIATRVYTPACDVYSYGILVWEIFNDAEMPYKGIDNKTIKAKISEPDFRPNIDPAIPHNVQVVMKCCWNGDPAQRPTMKRVFELLLRKASVRRSHSAAEEPAPDGSATVIKHASAVFKKTVGTSSRRRSVAQSRKGSKVRAK